MMKWKKIFIFFGIIAFFISLEVSRLNYTIEAVRVNKEINIKKRIVKKIEKEIVKDKMKLVQKMDLDKMKKRAEHELDMDVSEKIKYIKIGKTVSELN